MSFGRDERSRVIPKLFLLTVLNTSEDITGIRTICHNRSYKVIPTLKILATFKLSASCSVVCGDAMSFTTALSASTACQPAKATARMYDVPYWALFLLECTPLCVYRSLLAASASCGRPRRRSRLEMGTSPCSMRIMRACPRPGPSRARVRKSCAPKGCAFMHAEILLGCVDLFTIARKQR